MIVTVEYDTKNKTLTVIKGGQKVENLSSISFYKNYEGKHSMELSQYEVSDEDGTSERTCTYAALANKILGIE